MYPMIDFRNGRYQGQTRNQLPHGVGFFMDKSFMLCLGEWVAGQLSGYCIVIFPSGRVFAGGINYRQLHGLGLYELAEDHVQLVVAAKAKRDGNQKQREKMAAILPLLSKILDIDNTRREEAQILGEYAYSTTKDEENRAAMARILGLDRNGVKELISYSNFIQFFRDKFLNTYPQILQFIVNEHKGKKQYFLGLRGEGLGVKVQPSGQLSSGIKKSGKVYSMRSMGSFTKQNQLRELGIKTLDNPMKGLILQQGIFSLPQTLIKYQNGKRPLNCSINFHNYIKRSLFYRDKVLDTDYLYELEKFTQGFNKNLRVVQTERLAQFIIENPNSNGQNLAQIQRKRRQKEREREQQGFLRPKEMPTQPTNPYNPTDIRMQSGTDFNLNRVKDSIYRSASKKKALPYKIKDDYQNVEYIDPNYSKIQRDESVKIEKHTSFLPYRQRPLIDTPYRRDGPISPLNHRRNTSLSPFSRPKSKSPYEYLDTDDPLPSTSFQRPPYSRPSTIVAYKEPRKMPLQAKRPSQMPNKYKSEREGRPHFNESSLNDENLYSSSQRNAPKTPLHRFPQSEQPVYKSFLEDQTNISRYRLENPRPKYNYHFQDEEPSVSPFRAERR